MSGDSLSPWKALEGARSDATRDPYKTTRKRAEGPPREIGEFFATFARYRYSVKFGTGRKKGGHILTGFQLGAHCTGIQCFDIRLTIGPPVSVTIV